MEAENAPVVEETSPAEETVPAEEGEVIEVETTLPVPVVGQDAKLAKKEADNQARLAIANAAARSLSLGETDDLNELIRWGKLLAASGMFNDVTGPAQAIVKVLYGRELGLSPMESLTGIYFFSNKLVLSAGTMAGLVKKSGKYDYRIKHLDNKRCELEFFQKSIRDGDVHLTSLGVSVFTMEDAQLAGIVKGANWLKYPRNMLFARALSNGFKWFCQDLAQGGAYVAGEIDGDGTPIDAEFIMDPR